MLRLSSLRHKERQDMERQHFDFIREVLGKFFGGQYVVSAAENLTDGKEGDTNEKERKSA